MVFLWHKILAKERSEHGARQRQVGVYLWLACVLIGLDEDLADADVLAHGPQRWLHGLARPQDGDAGDLRKDERDKIKEQRRRAHDLTEFKCIAMVIILLCVYLPVFHGKSALHSPVLEGSEQCVSVMGIKRERERERDRNKEGRGRGKEREMEIEGYRK